MCQKCAKIAKRVVVKDRAKRALKSAVVALNMGNYEEASAFAVKGYRLLSALKNRM
jgi:HEPN domain-containing protein